jgi:hypothetical protein
MTERNTHLSNHYLIMVEERYSCGVFRRIPTDGAATTTFISAIVMEVRVKQIFDASCQSTEGIPGCIDEIYDYQHPPIRYWDTFLPLNVDDGIIHEASYINNGDVPVYFGLTSADEMMVLIYFYLEDTTGLNLPASLPEQEPLIGVQLYPNPASDVVYMRVDQQLSADVELLVSDVNGRTVYDAGGSETAGSNFIQIHRNGLPDGLYVVQLRQNGQIIYSDKLLFH